MSIDHNNDSASILSEMPDTLLTRVAMELAGEDGCCCIVGEAGECCMTDRARNVIAIIATETGITLADLEAARRIHNKINPPRKQRMPLHSSVAHLVHEFMDGVAKGNFPAGENVEEHLADAIQKRFCRYINADHIAMILEENARIEGGALANQGYLAVKIAESIERGDAA